MNPESESTIKILSGVSSKPVTGVKIMAMSREERAARKAEREATKVRMEKNRAEAIAIVATGKCPECGAGLRNNLAMTGWWQCQQFGAEGFRKDSSKPACSFQCFTV